MCKDHPVKDIPALGPIGIRAAGSFAPLSLAQALAIGGNLQRTTGSVVLMVVDRDC